MFPTAFDHLAWIKYQFLSVRRDSRKAGSTRSKEVNTPELIDQKLRIWVRVNVGVLREFGKRFLRKRAALFKSGQWHFHQDNAPVHNSILVTKYLSKLGIKTVAHLDERGCDEGHWHAHTRGLPLVLSEVVGTVQVHCSRRTFLRRGLEFHVFTINKNAHAKKVWILI